MLSLPGCAGVTTRAPQCDASRRLAVVAQSVPDAAYVPCVTELRPGWRTERFKAERGATTFSLVSDRASSRPVRVAFRSTCALGSASSGAPRAAGVRTYRQVRSVSPQYAGRLTDVFAGGCVTYDFAFDRGPHIALIEDFESIVGLRPRRELRLDLHNSLDVELDP